MTSPSHPATRPQPPATDRLRALVSGNVIFVALAIECLVLAVATDAFLTPDNLSNVLRQNAFTAILAAGRKSAAANTSNIKHRTSYISS